MKAFASLIRGFFSAYLSVFFLFWIITFLLKDTYTEGITPKFTALYRPVILIGYLSYVVLGGALLLLWILQSLLRNDRPALFGNLSASILWLLYIWWMGRIYLTYWE